MAHALLQAVARGAGVQVDHCPRAQVHALRPAAQTGSAAKTGPCYATPPWPVQQAMAPIIWPAPACHASPGNTWLRSRTCTCIS